MWNNYKNMQKIILIGNLGKDAVHDQQNGLIRLTVAVEDKVKNQQGAWEKRATWYNCTQWYNKGGNPPALLPYLLKGCKVAIEGKPEAQLGNDGKAYLGVKVSGIEMLVFKKTDEAPKPVQQQPAAPVNDPWAGSNDDLPF